MSSAVLMRSVSGLRAVVGEGLTPENIIRHVAAFASIQRNGKMVIGRDSRVSGPFMVKLVSGVLMGMGREVIDLGIVPTPTVQFMVEKLKAAGGIAITASHNPVQWNGLKFIDSDGLFLMPDKIATLFSKADENHFTYVPYPQLGTEQQYEQAITEHIEAILGLPFLDLDRIRSRKFRVVVDTVNGAGGKIIPELLARLGCEVIALNTEMNGLFAHTPEPLPENLTGLCQTIREKKADLGIAVDPDVDRCALVDETGTPLGEEYTLALAVKCVLSKKLGPVVTNLSTSRVIDDVVMYYNSILYRTPVGEIHVAGKMREIGAVIGGEGNGGVILPDVHLGRDAPVAVALTLQLMAEENRPISAIKQSLPQYEIVKDKIDVQGLNVPELMNKIREKFKNARMNEDDGLKIDLPDYWIHFRKSNTEPIVRIIVEAGDRNKALDIVDSLKKEMLSWAK